MNIDDTNPTNLSPQAKWNTSNPKAIWAHAALRSAIKKGLIVRGTCEVCGSEQVDGHHDDYDKPMVVRWLCRLHHRHLHSRADDAEGGAA